jgi:hypothetical protein
MYPPRSLEPVVVLVVAVEVPDPPCRQPVTVTLSDELSLVVVLGVCEAAIVVAQAIAAAIHNVRFIPVPPSRERVQSRYRGWRL